MPTWYSKAQTDTLLAGKATPEQIATAINVLAASIGATYIALPAGGADGQVLGRTGGQIAWVTPAPSAPPVSAATNNDGTTTYSGQGVTDNGDGTFALTGSTVTDNGDGTFTIAA